MSSTFGMELTDNVGNQYFTTSNPGSVSLTGSNATIGTVKITGTDGNNLDAVSSIADSSAGSGILSEGKFAFNESTWDRVRNNTQGTLLASAARTSQTSSSNQTNYNAKGLLLTLNVSAAPNTTETLGLWLLLIDPISGMSNNGVLVSINTAQGSTIQSGAIYRLLIYPGITGAPTNPQISIASFVVPRTWAGTVSPSGASSWTYSLAASLIN